MCSGVKMTWHYILVWILHMCMAMSLSKYPHLKIAVASDEQLLQEGGKSMAVLAFPLNPD